VRRVVPGETVGKVNCWQSPRRRSSMVLGSGCPLHPHDAQSGVQDQPRLPSGGCAKIRHGVRAYRHVASNLHSHVVAVAEQNFFHILDCVGCRTSVLPNRYSLFETTLQSHFAQSARAVALTVSSHQVQVSLSSFTPTLCSVPLPALMVHCPDTTRSEPSLQCASQVVL
jgi:hypothetical protein